MQFSYPNLILWWTLIISFYFVIPLSSVNETDSLEQAVNNYALKNINSITLQTLDITPPSTMYIGPNFLVTVSCAETPDVSTVTLNLVYVDELGSYTLVQAYDSVAINQEVTLVAPSTLSTSTSYYLQVAADADFNSATSTSFSASNVQLQFAQPPSSSTYVYPATIPILINSADVSSVLPSNQELSVTLTCGSTNIETFPVTIGTQTNYANPNIGGSCFLSATSPISYLLVPSSLSLTLVQSTVSISSSPSTAAASGTAAITLNYSPTPASAVSSTITLTCPSVGSSSYVGSGTSISFPVPSNLYGNSCTFSVAATNYFSSGPVSVKITQPLTFSSPASGSVITITNPVSPISVNMSTGTVNAAASIVLQLACTNYASEIPTFTVTTSVEYSYSSYPSTAYGPCTLSVVSAPDYLVPPSPLSFNLKYALTITPPSIMYIGQSFSVTVSCAQTPGVSTVALNLVYTPAGGSSSTIESYTVTLNQSATFTAPTTLSTGSGYTFQVASNENFNSATSTSFSASNVQLQFAQPLASSTYVYPATIPILINSADVTSILPSNQQISVTLTCENVNIDTFSVTIGTQTNYANSNGGIGSCTLSASVSTSYLLAPSNLDLTIKGTVAIASVGSSIPAGQSVQLGLTYDPVSTTVTSSVVLTCPNLNPSTASVTGTTPSYTVPSGLYGNSCVFSVVSQYYNLNSTVSTIVTQTLSFSLPSTNLITINNAIPIKVATSPNTTISESVQLKFNCSSPSTMADQYFSVTTSVADALDYQYPSTAFGTCFLSVYSASSYFVLPSVLSLSLKYALTITPPSTMYLGQSFSVTVSCAQTPVINTVALNLVYTPAGGSSSIIESYTVTLNQTATFTASTTLSTGSGYTFQVAADANFNSATSSSFSVSKVPLRFAKPSGNSAYNYRAAIPILINSANVANILPLKQPLTVTVTCASSISDTFSAYIGTQVNYRLPSVYIGSCTIKATSSVSYWSAPSKVNVNSKGTVVISSLSSVSAGETTQLGLTYDPVSTTVSSTVKITCPGLSASTASVTGIAPTFTVPKLLYGANCAFSVTSSYYVANNTASTMVTQILSFTSPTSSSNVITIDNPIPIKVGTSPNTTISATINLKFNCSSPSTMTSQYFDVTSSAVNALNYQYPSTAFGSCFLSVYSAPSYFILPTALDLSLQYNLTIDAPARVFPREPFIVTVTCPQTPGVDIVTLNLIYTSNSQKSTFNTPRTLIKRYPAVNSIAGTAIQSYNVTINQPSTLVAPSDLVVGTNYTLALAPSSAFGSDTTPTITAAAVQNLAVSVPASIRFGQPVTLKVDTDGPYPTQYTASFACPTGSFEIRGLTTGIVYNLVPPGIYGTVVITATADRSNTGVGTLQIIKSKENIPSFLIPGILPNLPSIYTNITEESS